MKLQTLGVHEVLWLIIKGKINKILPKNNKSIRTAEIKIRKNTDRVCTFAFLPVREMWSF